MTDLDRRHPRHRPRGARSTTPRLVRREDENESLAYFWVRFDGEPTPFEAGQYMTIGVMVEGKIVQRPYSVASAPAVAGSDGYEFYVRLVEGGTFTPLLWRLPIGHAMRMIGPKGKFMLQPDDERTHIFISSGTGNAPFVAMMRQLLIDGRPRPVVFLNGVSYADELGYRAILDDWEASGDLPGHLRPDRLAAGRPAQRGLDGPNRAASRRSSGPSSTSSGSTPANSIAYICGNPDMILAAEATLLERGYAEDQVHKELYWPKGKEPRGVAGADLAAAIEAAEANADQ